MHNDKSLPLITLGIVYPYHLPGKQFSNIYCLTLILLGIYAKEMIRNEANTFCMKELIAVIIINKKQSETSWMSNTGKQLNNI